MPPSISGDGDLGMLAMGSRSPATSFDNHEDARARAAAANSLTAIPAYPGSISAAHIPRASGSKPTSSADSYVQNQRAVDNRTSEHVLGTRMREEASNNSSNDVPMHAATQSAPGSTLTSSATSSRLGALSLQDEVSQDHMSGSSTSPVSARSTSNSGHNHLQSSAISSSSSNYNSAHESPVSDVANPGHSPVSLKPSASAASSQPQPASNSSPPSTAPPPSISNQSIASNSTITQSRLPTSRSLASSLSADKHAMSVEQELDADQDVEGTSSAGHSLNGSTLDDRVAARTSRRSKRSGVPPLQERLPVGGGGPSAPPRTASFRDASKRTSVGAGHGDLGVDIYNPSSPSMTSFLDLDSPTVSESSHTNRYPVPSRRTSLHAPSPRTPTFSTYSGTQQDTTASGSSTSQASSRPTSSGSKAAIAAAAAAAPTAKADSTLKPESGPAASTLNLDRETMQRWVLSVGCVNFDLELGPDLEFLYPPLGISREERDNIAFSSFPDTSIFDDGSLVFSWRVREVPLDSSESEPPTIKSIGDALPQPPTVLDEETPRPSMNKAALQNAMAQKGSTVSKGGNSNNLSVPTSPTSPSTSGFKDSSASSTASSAAPSRKASEANLKNASSPPSTTGNLPSTTSFHERLTQKLFSSSGTSSMARHFSHDRHSSTHSTSSVSTIDETDSTTTAATSQNSTSGASSSSPQSSEILAPKRVGNSTSSSYIYGYVFFRQKRDPTNRRGYFQKSVVILSHLPLVGLFSEVVARLGPLYFEHGMSMFEAFANDIMAWPPPTPGTILTLPLLGSIITAAIPFGQQPQNSPNSAPESAAMAATLSGTSASSGGGGRFGGNATMTLRTRSRQSQPFPEPLIGPEGPLLASIPTTSLFETFKEALSDLWLIWECVLLAEPILVIAPEPKIASEAVWHMLDLIRPIPYAGDFRPYFHIHDYDFRTLVTKNKPQAGTLVAATNPFFATACGHWPHVLRVGKAAVKVVTFKHGGSATTSGGKKGGSGGGGGGIGGGQGAGGGGPDHIPGFSTKRKRRISKDRQLLKRLQDLAASAGKGGEEAAISAANVTMRRYFADLTERFLSPLNRYVASLVPASFDLSSPSEVPRIRPFNTAQFLSSLKTHGTPLAIRSRSLPTGASVRQSLYLDFLKCPNFSLWLHSRVAAAEEEQRRRYIASLLQGDVTAFGRSKGEIETVDLYSRLVEEIRLVDLELTAPTEPGLGSRWRTDKPAQRPTGAQGGGQGGSARGTVGNANSATTTEKRLVEQKKRLMVQLEKLCQTLPDDLRSSLRRPN